MAIIKFIAGWVLKYIIERWLWIREGRKRERRAQHEKGVEQAKEAAEIDEDVRGLGDDELDRRLRDSRD